MSDRSWSMLKWSGIGTVVAIILAVPLLPGRTEPVTKDRLAAALRLWQAANVANYDMDLETTGAQTGMYHVEVRDGQLSRITRNGQAADPAAGEYWTVDGLFHIIEQEQEDAEHLGSGMFPEQTRVWLRMRCDSKFGYPVRYTRQAKYPSQRTETGYESPGAFIGIEIRVSRFEPK